MPNMKASELRIGNLVDLGNRIAKISEIYHTACTVLDLEETQDTIEDYERTKPIPLTEEWLLKFGFDRNIVEDYPIFQNQVLMIEYYEACSDVYVSDYCKISTKYVHQLQNLYFALTGEELILNI